MGSKDQPAHEVVDFLRDVLILRKDGSVEVSTRNSRSGPEVAWIVGVVNAADGQAVHSDYWERHLGGAEILWVLDGDLQLTLTMDFVSQRRVHLAKEEATVVPPGTWHRIEVESPARLLFVSPGSRTDHRRADRT